METEEANEQTTDKIRDGNGCMVLNVVKDTHCPHCGDEMLPDDEYHINKECVGVLAQENKDADKKQFKAYWGDGYSVEQEKTVGESFFKEDIGYPLDNIDKINKMGINETLDLTDISGIHTIKRIK